MPALFSLDIENEPVGAFDFLTIRGVPQPLGDKIDVVTHAGFTGAAVWNMGRNNPTPFAMQTVAEITDAANGKVRLQRYKRAVGKVGTLTYQGSEAFEGITDLGATQVMVLDVRGIDIRAVVVPVGFEDSNSRAIILAEWFLLPWHVEA